MQRPSGEFSENTHLHIIMDDSSQLKEEPVPFGLASEEEGNGIVENVKVNSLRDVVPSLRKALQHKRCQPVNNKNMRMLVIHQLSSALFNSQDSLPCNRSHQKLCIQLCQMPHRVLKSF